MIELGGKIRLHGFEALDHAELLIAKKLVGSYIRHVCDKLGDCEQADITLERLDERYKVMVAVRTPSKQSTADAEGENVFMTIDASLKRMLQKLGIKI